MTIETTEKMLERVRALLAKAEGTDFPAEAEAFRAKADELMTRHSIGIWQVEEAQRGVERRVTPTRRDFAHSWSKSRFRSELRMMFFTLAQHCRCVIGHRGIKYGENAYTPVYGLPSDLAYLDALFTSLMLEVAKNLQPPVDPNGEIGHEVFKQRQAGIEWPEITRKIVRAGLTTVTRGEFKKLQERAYGDLDGYDKEDVTWDDITRHDPFGFDGGVRESIKNRLANYNRKYVRDNGLHGQRNYVRPEVYQRSFMMGFEDEIEARVMAQQASSRKAYDADHGSGSMSLAVRDIRSQALDVYNADFPPPPPPPPLTEEEIKKINKLPVRRVKMREVAVDYGAMNAGRQKAREVNLSNNPSRRVGGDKPGLPE